MFLELARKRRSIKKFTAQAVPDEKMDEVLEAALRAPSGRKARPWAFVVVKDKQSLEKLSVAKPSGAEFIKAAAAAIIVCADPAKSQLWIEDCAIAAVSMQYAAHDMGLGSRWCQIRGTQFSDTSSSRDYIAQMVGLPDGLEIECIIAVGFPGEQIAPYRPEELAFDQIGYERYGATK